MVSRETPAALGYRMPATLAEWRLFILFAAFNSVVPFLLIVWGQARATGGMAAILNASAPLFGIFLAHMLTQDEKLSWNKLAGIVVGIVGVGILVGYDFAVGSSADVLARLALLTAPLLYVCANIFARTKLGHYPPFVVAMMQMVGAVFVAFPLAIVIDQPWTLPMPSIGAARAAPARRPTSSLLPTGEPARRPRQPSARRAAARWAASRWRRTPNRSRPEASWRRRRPRSPPPRHFATGAPLLARRGGRGGVEASRGWRFSGRQQTD